MKLTENKLRKIIREELTKLSEVPNPEVMQKKSVSSSFPSAEDGKVYGYDQKEDRIRKISPRTAEEKDRYRKPNPEELDNLDERVKKQLRKVVREELSKLAKKQQMNELSFREDKMRELLTREPKLDRIRREGGNSLKDMFDKYVKRNKEMKRKYKQASPQPAQG